MKETLRKARSDDTSALKNIWKTVFGDTDAFVDAFFRHYGAKTATVAQIGGDIAAAGYLLPVGCLNLPDGNKYPCAMIYSVAVLPAFRSRGLGAELTRELIASGHADGFPAVTLRPASDSLFDYYSSHTAMREWFYMSEREFAYPGTDAGKLVRLTVAEYARLRGELLRDIAHIETDERALSFHNAVCGLEGGGLFSITAPGVDGCAAAESDGSTIFFKELLARGAADEAAAAAVGALPANGHVIRAPARGVNREGVRGFGMLAADLSFPELAERPEGAWFGLAFD